MPSRDLIQAFQLRNEDCTIKVHEVRVGTYVPT